MDRQLKNLRFLLILLINLKICYCTSLQNKIYVVKSPRFVKSGSNSQNESFGAEPDRSDSSYAESQSVEDIIALDTIVYNRFAKKPNSTEESSSEEPEGPPDHSIPYTVHEEEPDIFTKPKYVATGEWAKPSPEKNIPLDFVPTKVYAQVRGTNTLQRLPQEEAVNSADTSEEKENAARLRKVVKNTKVNTVYTEEGYEDSAYDHGGQIRDADFHEGYARKLHDQKIGEKFGNYKNTKKNRGRKPMKMFTSEEFKNFNDDYSDHLRESASVDNTQRPLKYTSVERDKEKSSVYSSKEDDIDPKRLAEKGLKILQEDLTRDAEETEKSSDSGMEHRSESKNIDDNNSDLWKFDQRNSNEQTTTVGTKKRRKLWPRIKIPTGSYNKDSARKKTKSSQTLQESGKYSEENPETTTISFNRQKSSEREAYPNQLTLSSNNNLATLNTIKPVYQLSQEEGADNTDYGQIFREFYKNNKNAPTSESIPVQGTAPTSYEENRTPVALATFDNRGPYLLMSNDQVTTTLPSTLLDLQTYYPETVNFDYFKKINTPISPTVANDQSWTTPLHPTLLTDDIPTSLDSINIEDDSRSLNDLAGKSEFKKNPFLGPLLQNSPLIKPLRPKYKVIVRDPSDLQYSSEESKNPHGKHNALENMDPKYLKMLEYIIQQQGQRYPGYSSSFEQIVNSGSGSNEGSVENLSIMRPPLMRQSEEGMYSDFLPYHSRGKLENADYSSVSTESESSDEDGEQLEQYQPHNNAVPGGRPYGPPPSYHPGRPNLRPPPNQRKPPNHYQQKPRGMSNFPFSKFPPFRFGKPPPKNNYRPVILKIRQSIDNDRRRRRFVDNESNDKPSNKPARRNWHGKFFDGSLKRKRHKYEAPLKKKYINLSRLKRSAKNHEELLEESPKISGDVIDKEIDARFNSNEDDNDTNDKSVEAEVPDFDYVEEFNDGNEIKIFSKSEPSLDYEKYPYYNNSQLPNMSVLRYIVDPRRIPRKTGGRMVFYESRDAYKKCEEVEPNLDKVLPDKEEPDPERGPIGDSPRLKGLGDRLDCFKAKYFDENPLDNPLFLEKTIETPNMPVETYAKGFSKRILRFPKEKDEYIVQKSLRLPEIPKNKRRAYTKNSEESPRPRKLVIVRKPSRRRPSKFVRRPNRGLGDRQKYRRGKGQKTNSLNSSKTQYTDANNMYATPYERQVYEDVMGNIQLLANDQEFYGTATTTSVVRKPKATQVASDVENKDSVSKFEREKDTGFPIVHITENPDSVESIQELSPPPYPTTRLKRRPYYRQQHVPKDNKQRHPANSRFVRHYRPIHLNKRSASRPVTRNSIFKSKIARDRHILRKRSLSIDNGRSSAQRNTEIEKMAVVTEATDLLAEETRQDLIKIAPTKSTDINNMFGLTNNVTKVNDQGPAHTSEQIIYTIKDRIRHSKPKDSDGKIGKFSNDEVTSNTNKRNEPGYKQIRRRKAPTKGTNETPASTQKPRNQEQLYENQHIPFALKTSSKKDSGAEVESVSVTTEQPYEPVTSAEYARIKTFLASDPPGYAEAFPEETRKSSSEVDATPQETSKSLEQEEEEESQEDSRSSESLEKRDEFFNDSDRPYSPPEYYEDPKYADLGPRVNKPAFYHPPFSLSDHKQLEDRYSHGDSNENDSSEDEDEFAESTLHRLSLDRYEYPWEKRERLERERRQKEKEKKYDRLKRLFESQEDEYSLEDEEATSSNSNGKYKYPWEKYNVPSKRYTRQKHPAWDHSFHDNDEEGSENHPVAKYSSQYKSIELKNPSGEELSSSKSVEENSNEDSIKRNPVEGVKNQKRQTNTVKSMKILAPTNEFKKVKNNQTGSHLFDTNLSPMGKLNQKNLSARNKRKEINDSRKTTINSSENQRTRFVPVKTIDSDQSTVRPNKSNLGRKIHKDFRNNHSYSTTEKTVTNSNKRNTRRRMKPVITTTTNAPVFSSAINTRRRKVDDKEVSRNVKISSSSERERLNSKPSTQVTNNRSNFKTSRERINTKTSYPSSEKSSFEVQQKDLDKQSEEFMVPVRIIHQNTSRINQYNEYEDLSEENTQPTISTENIKEDLRNFPMLDTLVLAAKMQSLTTAELDQNKRNNQKKEKQEELEGESPEETAEERKRKKDLLAKVKDPGNRLYYYIEDRRK